MGNGGGTGQRDASTFLRVRPEEAAREVASFVLVVVQGQDAGARLVIDASNPSRVLVGTSPSCELRLADREVSRRHAAFDVDGQRLRLTDVGSTNGTFVNGIAVMDAFLVGGEAVQVGVTVLRVERTGSRVPAVSQDLRFGRMLGGSQEMRRLYPTCLRLALSPVPLIVEGETGTGKELLAEALHEAGPRSAGPFVVLDCGTIPPGMAEALLFGAEGTGGAPPRPGVFEQAHGGTLLLDEIGELALDLQPKLLRVLERGELRRVGGLTPIAFDVRVMVATRRNLDAEVQAARFRDDLFFRLAVARIELPPLRKRGGDVALLARHFWRQLEAPGGAGPVAMPTGLVERLEAYEWPGNVRELRNTIAEQLALGELAGAADARGPDRPSPTSARPGVSSAEGPHWADVILAEDLPMPRARQRLAEEFERRYVERILARYGGNVARAATASGLARRYFQLLRARHTK